MSDELVVVKAANIPALFADGGCDPIIEGLKKEAAKFKGDITTAKGRKEIASFARKFSTSKVYLNGLGKALSDEYRAKIAPINVERNKIEACCDELRDKIRKPLTDWEDAEKKRVADIEERIQALNDYAELVPCTSTEAENILKEFNAIAIDESFEEFELAASKAKDKVAIQLEAKHIVLLNEEKVSAEAERLEAERLEKEQKDREEKIAKEAAEKATREAEEKAKADADAKEEAAREAKLAEEKAATEQKEAEAKATKEAEDKAKAEQEEKDKTAQDEIDKAKKTALDAELAAATAEREKREAEEKAKEQAELAVEDEKRKVAEDKRLADIKEQKRQDNVKHRNKIHKEAKASLLEQGISEEDATIFVTMVKDGLVKHITINY